jgi:adenylate cyclase
VGISRRLTLDQLFVIFLLLTAGLLAGLFWFLHHSTEMVVERSSSLLLELDQTSHLVGEEVSRYFEEAADIVRELDTLEYLELQRFPDDRLRMALRLQLMTASDISEVCFISADPPSQVTVFRNPEDKIETSRIVLHEGSFRELGTGLEVKNPTEHPTFQTLTQPNFKGRMLWSDLHFSQTDTQLSKGKPRVVVTAQKAIYDTDGTLLGLVRVGRFIDALTKITQRGGEADGQVGKWVFLCDSEGRLVTQLSAKDAVVEHPDVLRVGPAEMPPEVQEALTRFSQSEAKQERSLSRFEVGPERYFSLIQPLEESQDWFIGVVVPETYFLAEIKQSQRQLLLASLLIFATVLGLGFLFLRVLRGDIGQLVARIQSMKDFKFESTPPRARIEDLHHVETGLENAKASLRALSKYVPLDLVKRLYEQEIEPQLGGEMLDISLMFTDVAGFTSVAESLSIEELASALAIYLDRMNGAIQEHDGAILERIGDALLSVWNAPTVCTDHPRRLCEAALECAARTRDLNWDTRYGLHRGEVMVGHFGSEDRMNYGLLGDDVNLAARIEGLNKHYGTKILASVNIYNSTKDIMEFRLVDEVAVKGRTSGVRLYELLGRKGEVSDTVLQVAQSYEQAFGLYQSGDFSAAEELLATLPDDPPSQTLSARCRAYLQTPPPEGWNGVFVATFK